LPINYKERIKEKEMDDWIELNAIIDYQNFWSPRNTAEDAELIHLSKTGKYFELGDNLDVLIGRSIDGNYMYMVIDWEEDGWEDNTEKSISFRILTTKKA